MLGMNSLKTLAAAGLLALMAGGASAATCNISNFTTSTQCVSPVSGGGGGNVNVAQMNGQSIFGSSNWSLLAELAKPGTQSNGSPFVFSVVYGPNGAQSGTWSLNPL